MKRMYIVAVLCLFVTAFLSGCGGPTFGMKNIRTNSITSPDKVEVNGKVRTSAKAEENIEMRIQPHQTFGLEPTPAICRGDISTYLFVFSKRLLGGEYFLGTLRWNGWVVRDNGSESFAQGLFSGIHPSGDYFGTAVLDGNVADGQMVFHSTDMKYIYSPFGRELEIEWDKYSVDPAYRRKKIQEVNRMADGKDFNIRSLTPVPGFRDVIKTWNQIRYPEGYLLSPYGVDEVALIRGQNPQYSYFQKLIGTGRFAIKIGIDPVGMAIVNAAGIAMDLARAVGAPSKGRDFSSVVSRREQSFANEYLLALAEAEMKKRNAVNVELFKQSQQNGRSLP